MNFKVTSEAELRGTSHDTLKVRAPWYVYVNGCFSPFCAAGPRARPAHGHAHPVFRVHAAPGGERRGGLRSQPGGHEWLCEAQAG